jgi:hypothetical protein
MLFIDNSLQWLEFQAISFGISPSPLKNVFLNDGDHDEAKGLGRVPASRRVPPF